MKVFFQKTLVASLLYSFKFNKEYRKLNATVSKKLNCLTSPLHILFSTSKAVQVFHTNFPFEKIPSHNWNTKLGFNFIDNCES